MDFSDEFLNPPGQISPGNIDIYNRPQTKLSDGSIATVRSMGIGGPNNINILIPTIGPKGEDWSKSEAIDNYRKTGQHLGIFDSPENSDNYAQKLHIQQSKMLNNNIPEDSQRQNILDYLMSKQY